MGLREFLKQHDGVVAEMTPRSQIATWQAAVSTLVARFKEALAAYEQLHLADWAVLREHRGVRYNADALTIEFSENAITLEPVAIGPEAGVDRGEDRRPRDDRASSYARVRGSK